MAGNLTQVDLAGLQRAITVFSNGVTNFDSQYKSMSTTVAGIQSVWTGQAFQAFDRALQQWLVDFSKVISVLNGMENALSQNTSVLTQTNEETIQKAQMVASQITVPTLPGF
ncbi:WXG100 family type VII secretion target [Streptomyces chartreusis]|uniref:WXG100 family type VII secretion target n=1 Tax=Streptomyces chartreusis TaxID=1969 RepID=A0A7I0Y8Y5_STRCX|nr:WXG100 family type VII secretion target [Streptomyces chartreusis]QKZ15966.1 WXG100 family type VII secretion target [Streptomyces chartreusis]